MGKVFKEALAIESTRYLVEDREKWKEWCRKVPALNFKPDWAITVLPPYGGAIARFVAEKNGKFADVYLDVYSRLGWEFDKDENGLDDEPRPYWELYPDPDSGDVNRYYLGEENELLLDISRLLDME